MFLLLHYKTPERTSIFIMMQFYLVLFVQVPTPLLQRRVTLWLMEYWPLVMHLSIMMWLILEWHLSDGFPIWYIGFLVKMKNCLPLQILPMNWENGFCHISRIGIINFLKLTICNLIQTLFHLSFWNIMDSLPISIIIK